MSDWDGQWTEEHKMRPMDGHTELERRLIAALTPSAETKAAYIGEVKHPVTVYAYSDVGEPSEFPMSVTVSWTATKEIMALIRKQAGIE